MRSSYRPHVTTPRAVGSFFLSDALSAFPRRYRNNIGRNTLFLGSDGACALSGNAFASDAYGFSRLRSS
jgi:hypothetical protein